MARRWCLVKFNSCVNSKSFWRTEGGNWDHYNPIPDDAAGFDTFEKLRDQLHETLQQLLESTDNSSDSLAVTKAKDLYRSCMDLGE